MLKKLCLLLLIILTGCSSESDKPNIVFVVLDTVRSDAVGVNTPAFNRLASKSARFNNAFSAAPWTVPSHGSMFTGRLPSDHGCTFAHPKLSPLQNTIAAQLSENGYNTAAFYSNPWLSDRATGLLRGFSEKQEAVVGGLGQLVSKNGDQGGRKTLSNISSWLKTKNDEPYFIFVNFLEAHLPFDPPADYRKKLLIDLPIDDSVSINWGHEFNAGLHSDVDWSRIKRLYEGDVNHADRLFGALLKELGDLENTVVIVTADHGENIGDHNLMEHQFSVDETLISVPLILYAPDYIAPGDYDSPKMTTDIYATILEISGIETQELPHSKSLLSKDISLNRPVVAEYSGPSTGLKSLIVGLNPELDTSNLFSYRRTVRSGNLRLTVADQKVTLHNLESDPKQLSDIALDNESAVNMLLEMLDNPADSKWLEYDNDVELDPETRRQLESLGYVR
jgi:arylsulfatase A-like enzyme